MTRYSKTMSESLAEVRSVTPEQIAEASARRDAMRHGAGGRRGIDPADRDDVKATDKDQELAKKNMIMQLRKSKDTKGNFSIEFQDGKKQKVDPKFVELLLKAHDMIQKPRDKEQFVGMISKSYRDMLKTAKMVSKQLRMGEEVILEAKEEYVCEDCGCEQGNADPNCSCPNDSTDLQASYWVKKEEIEIDEMKMDDPKLNKIFDKLKKGQTIKLKTSSTISKGKDFVDYIVKSKNTVNKGRVEKITMARKDSPTSAKRYLYKRDEKVTMAFGDMAVSPVDIKEGVEPIQWPSQPLPEDFTPHMMYDPKTGKGYKAEKEADHLRMKDMGYTHEKPEMKEEEEPQKPDSAKEVEQGRDDKKKTRIAQLQLQIAKAQETINKMNAQEK